MRYIQMSLWLVPAAISSRWRKSLWKQVVQLEHQSFVKVCIVSSSRTYRRHCETGAAGRLDLSKFTRAGTEENMMVHGDTSRNTGRGRPKGKVQQHKNHVIMGALRLPLGAQTVRYRCHGKSVGVAMILLRMSVGIFYLRNCNRWTPFIITSRFQTGNHNTVKHSKLF